MLRSMQNTEPKTVLKKVQVAIAVIKKDTCIFISKRADDVDLASLWEFPGGKIEVGESSEQAVIRECQEEVGITPTNYRPFINLNYTINQKHIFLDVFLVDDFSGTPFGKEGQLTQWVEQETLHRFDFPKINSVIIKALNLPDQYCITHSFIKNKLAYCQQIEQIVKKHKIKLLQFRSPLLNASQRRPLAKKIKALCDINRCKLVINGNANDGFNRVHLTSSALKVTSDKDIASYKLVGASCHNEQELQMAEKKGCHYAVLSPVKKTKTHPDAKPLGWQRFEEMVKPVNIPVYALGGMKINDLSQAFVHGAQGIAAIGAFNELP